MSNKNTTKNLYSRLGEMGEMVSKPGDKSLEISQTPPPKLEKLKIVG